MADRPGERHADRGSDGGWGALKCAPESRKWLRGLDLNQRPLGYEGSHELISNDLVRRG
jgi:hypothetical protein